MSKRKARVQRVPAVPPNDYEESMADWMIGLQERGWWNGKGWYGDVMLTNEQWYELLEECEGTATNDDKEGSR